MPENYDKYFKKAKRAEHDRTYHYAAGQEPKNESFRKGKTSGNYSSHKQQDEMEKKYRSIRKSLDKHKK